MCGRVIQSSGALRLAIANGLDVSDSRMGNLRPRYNAAPSQELLVIRQNQKTGERSLELIKWGLVPHWCSDPHVSIRTDEDVADLNEPPDNDDPSLLDRAAELWAPLDEEAKSPKRA
jgi:putative SOS response-associated peptidase YedK